MDKKGEPVAAPKAILFIDHDQDIRDYVDSIVSEQFAGQFNIRTVATLTAAEAALGQNKFDGILIDVLDTSLDDVVEFVRKTRVSSPQSTVVALMGFVDMILDDRLKQGLAHEKVKFSDKVEALKLENIRTLFELCSGHSTEGGIRVNEERYTVLIVDDDEEVVAILKDHFKKRNCETIATQNPLTVVDKLRKFSIRLMLLDLKMRQLDGFGVLEKIKQEGLTLPPTIIITGFLPKYEDRLKNHGIGKADVVTKPFDFDVMEKAINLKLGSQIVTSEVGSEYEDKIYEKNRCRLGFVEDEKDVLEYFADFFGERNYKISCFSDGTTAYESLRKNPVDILLVDIKLPGMQGDKLIGQLSKIPHPPYMIPTSADPFSEEMEKTLRELGCKDFVSKPFDIIQLIEKIKTVATQKGLLG